MAGLELCEPIELYNVLNQATKFSRLTDRNYLCLIDARTKREYDESHLITAIRMKRELEDFLPYPVEIVPRKLYMGNYRQACDQQIQKDLKIKAHVNVSEEVDMFFPNDSDNILHIPVPDSPEADMLSFFSDLCHFIDSRMNHDAVLVFSTLGISRCSTAIMAYLIHSCGLYLKNAWSYVQKCKRNIRPNRGFVQQLSEWEARVYMSTVTDISEPNY
ncbi:serine/threonine/tyrosine-interacting-like protein 1 isoform X2 [Eublepharis macularius]|uniref:Serine/threonine/tyrosine-interacting-like protein 1 isoform X2 n=1 Tax=Eublepharis macularius TaxID=481883 RepID=A0AA97LA38_EUBMA|nr:serine/threonine/tyrosine-interacting-like protein 1 isoform X2 [Eublepharis macularius]